MNKFLKLENSKEVVHKAQGTTTSKKKERELKSRSKARRNIRMGPVENKDLVLKYTNYHSLTASVDHIYAVTNKNLYRQPDAMKGDKSQGDIKKNCVLHKDIGHNTERCMTLGDEIERLIRVGHFKEFLDEPQVTTREDQPR